MKSTAPWGENLLRHFCVNDDLEQEVLGDLFQDWNIHINEAGLWRANFRYLRQALSLVPHLLHCWVRRVNRLLAVKIGCFVVVLFAIVLVMSALQHSIKIIVISLIFTMLNNVSVGGPNTDPLILTIDWVSSALSISAISTIYATGAGILAGAFCGRASMIAVTWLSLLWAVVAPIYVLSSLPDYWPSWYLITFPICMVSGTIVGGCIGVFLRSRFLTWRKRRVV